ncbi:hypothetical protein RQP46_004110 [Phenoliferia psychrophenolica]
MLLSPSLSSPPHRPPLAATPSSYGALTFRVAPEVQAEAAKIHNRAISQLQATLAADLEAFEHTHSRAASTESTAELEATSLREQAVADLRETEIKKAMLWLGDHLESR